MHNMFAVRHEKREGEENAATKELNRMAQQTHTHTPTYMH